MYAFLALAGDSGCILGPAVAGAFGDDLHTGILIAVIFPVLLIAGIAVLFAMKKRDCKKERETHDPDQLS